MAEQKKVKRHIYLIKTRFQLKYVGLILLFMFIVGWISGYSVYYTGWLLMGEKLANVYPQGRLVAIMRTINFTLFLRLLLITPLVVLISVVLSHRIAGPLFRIERFLKSVAAGDFSARIHLRKNDELKDLADTINEMTDDLKSRVQKLKGLVNMTKADFDRLSRTLGEPVADTNAVKTEIGSLEKSIKELDDHLSEYRLTTVED